ncbi:hypothetical protein GCM10010282_37760 [Streptomyces roseolus]|nr:hypothetical protein GCM10010282_37760 [Streptomyces roseolus]
MRGAAGGAHPDTGGVARAADEVRDRERAAGRDDGDAGRGQEAGEPGEFGRRRAGGGRPHRHAGPGPGRGLGRGLAADGERVGEGHEASER